MASAACAASVDDATSAVGLSALPAIRFCYGGATLAARLRMYQPGAVPRNP
ncbi:MAG: hypothetical protein AVDCRST_MAG23-984 [uncultured Sphingosinicella sp.]|uniref:Uncharacterized protein n=1 Tax=uncultured Sphingosinicella sp. TaxID=478748 RepID=A0A6J4TS20_9SPHN|nr:MAG: hypothetical protein AVDCRST_MAG23-984 [uncultured Sphingosinicella sp.]